MGSIPVRVTKNPDIFMMSGFFCALYMERTHWVRPPGNSVRQHSGGVLDRYCEHTDRYDDPVHYAVWYRMASTEPELAGKPIIFGHTHTSPYGRYGTRRLLRYTRFSSRCV